MPELKIAAADCETDPALYQRLPSPFVWGFEAVDVPFTALWTDTYKKVGKKQSIKSRDEMGAESVEMFVDFLYTLPDPYCIYMHNGGKFDFMFLLPHLTEEAMIINGRIVKANIGPHQIRDSLAAVPVPLSAYRKDDMDYTKLEVDVRENHKADIIKYLGGDCRYLLEMMVAWREEFGDVLTMATGATQALKRFHKIAKLNEHDDSDFRRFYFGGRNQCFEVGEVKGERLEVNDINSSYPNAMRSMLHPIGNLFEHNQELTEHTDFVIVSGTNRGALCAKDDDGFLSFTLPNGNYDEHIGEFVFRTTGHELRAALETGTFEINKIHDAITCCERGSFAEFVDHYYGKRMDCASQAKELRAKGDINGALELELYVLFWKLVLNSSYGKQAINPDTFKDWHITEFDFLAMDPDIWNPEIINQGYIFWSKPAQHKNYLNVACGASITGAARSVLLHGLSKAVRPIYCDTDSIICERLDVDKDPKRLGAWKLEAEADTIYIAGKKLYALYKNGTPFVDDKGKEKKASKGVKLTADEIRRVALGDTIEYANPFPAFKLDGGADFIKRAIRRTDRNIVPFGV